MSFSQIPLNIWKKDYESDFIIGDSNRNALEVLEKASGQILLTGPNFSGKKHLANKISNKYNCEIFFVEAMKDVEIIALYDLFKIKFKKNEITYRENEVLLDVEFEKTEEKKEVFKKCIWVDSAKLKYSNDVASRLRTMHQAVISELSEDMFEALLKHRFYNLGFDLKDEIINYCIVRLPRSYFHIQKCIEYIKKNNKINLSILKNFLDSFF